MRPRRTAWLLAATLGLLTGMGSSEVDFSGTYLYLLETQTITKLPIVKDYVATTRSVSLVQLEHDGRTLKGHGPVCSVRISGSSSLVRTEIPPAFVRSLPETQVQANLLPGPQGLRLVQPAQTIVIGARLKDPANDPLPRSDADTRVFDQDRDGRPGVTVHVSGIVSGDVFVVQRSSSRLAGVKTAEGFAGDVAFSVEQAIVGATSPFLKGNRAGTPNPKGSFFRLARLPSQATCGDAEAKAQRLLSRP